MRKDTEEKINLILKRKQEGFTAQQIADETGYNKNTVNFYAGLMTRSGKIPKVRKPYTAEEMLLLLKKGEEGVSLSEISQQTGRSIKALSVFYSDSRLKKRMVKIFEAEILDQVINTFGNAHFDLESIMGDLKNLYDQKAKSGENTGSLVALMNALPGITQAAKKLYNE